MRSMFEHATSFNQNISNWNVSLVTNLGYAFHNATVFNQPIGNWDVSSVTDMFFLFNNSSAFNQSLSDWNVSSVTDMGSIFENAISLSDSNKGLIHASFDPNPNWLYDWSAFVTYGPSYPNHAVDLNGSVNLEMIWVEPGSFTMGSPTTEADRNTNETEHNVTLTKGFYLGKYEVTQAHTRL